ncbi:MAG TPA: hypothetical protein DEA68_00930, partial [Verrucomicrobiales bacterium]|nr:hypothetical protein [Verrucomicrobiales bacterium]
ALGRDAAVDLQNLRTLALRPFVDLLLEAFHLALESLEKFNALHFEIYSSRSINMLPVFADSTICS